MRTEELLEQCIQALTSGQDLPSDLVSYLSRHPEQRTEVEDMLFIAQRVSRVPPAELSERARAGMQSRLAEKLGFDPAAFQAPTVEDPTPLQQEEAPASQEYAPKKPLLSIGGVSLAKLRYSPPSVDEDSSEAAIRSVFRDLTGDDIRRYIGVRGEDYLYYRQKFPHWRPVFAVIAVVLRGLKRLETLAG